MNMKLIGDTNTPEMPMSESEVNHLRRLLSWMRCEWMLDPDGQRGYVESARWMVEAGYSTPEQVGEMMTETARKINQCPAYVRQAVKMLTKALREHERRSGVVDADAKVATPRADDGCEMLKIAPP